MKTIGKCIGAVLLFITLGLCVVGILFAMSGIVSVMNLNFTVAFEQMFYSFGIALATVVFGAAGEYLVNG